LSVLLIQPPFYTNKAEELAMKTIHHPSIGLACIEAVLNKNDVAARIIDLNIKPWEYVFQEIQKNNIKIVGITGYTFIASKMVDISKKIKKEFPNIIIVGGGVHASYYYKELLTKHSFDFIIRFEGEFPFLHLCNEILNSTHNYRSVKNLAFKDGLEIIKTGIDEAIENLDNLPQINIDLSEYPNKAVPIQVSRGCPYQCIYCSSSAYWGKKIRYRSIDSIKEEIIKNKQKGYTTFSFIDDQLNASENHFLQLMNMLIDTNIVWYGACVVNKLRKEHLDLLKKSKCQGLNIGIESADSNIQKIIGKEINLEHAYDIIKYAQKIGIKIVCGFILFHHCDTNESLKKTIEFSKKIQGTGARARFTYNTPFQGTYQYKKKKDLGIEIVSDNFDDFDLSNPVINTRYFKKSEMRSVFDISDMNTSEVNFSKIQTILQDHNITNPNDPRLNVEFIQKIILDHLK